MKKSYYYLFLIFIAYSCNNKNPKNIKTTKEQPVIEKSVQIRQFPSEKNLFLDFYEGMTNQEIKETLKRKIGKAEFFIGKPDLKDFWKIDKHHLDSLTINNIDSLTVINGFDRIYYQFSNGQKTFFAKVNFEFSTYSSLGSITLFLPDYAPTDDTNVKIIERKFEQGKLIKEMYKKKYGNPEIEVGEKNKMNELFYDVMDAKNIYNQNFHYFEDIYRYRNDDNKLISITSSLSGVSIKYSLYSDYIENIKEKEIKLKSEKNKENEIYQKTLENI